MENESSGRMGQFFSRLGDKIAEQQAFQQLKAKWDELDAQSRLAAKIASSGLSVLFVLFVIFGSLSSVRALRREVAEKSELLSTLQTANDELRKLNESGGGATGAPAEGWNGFFEASAAQLGLDKEKFAVNADTKGGSDGTLAKETLYDLALKQVNIKQVVRYAFQLENSGRPIKVRSLTIDTKPDMTGYLDATLSVSAFTPKEQ
jgi:hypothetical protein